MSFFNNEGDFESEEMAEAMVKERVYWITDEDIDNIEFIKSQIPALKTFDTSAIIKKAIKMLSDSVF